MENLPPLLARIDLDLKSGKVEFSFTNPSLAWFCINHAVFLPGFVNDLLTFFIEVIGVDAFEQHLVFPICHVVDMQNVLRLVAIFCACLPRFLPPCEVSTLV